jgi:hypothetical protein
MKHFFWLFCVTCIMPWYIVQAQNNTLNLLNDRWIQVDELIHKGLPESAEKELLQMLEISEKTGQTSEQLKINLTRYRLQTDKDGDAWQMVLIDMNTMIQRFPESALKSIAIFLLSDFYLTYYQNNSYLIDARTEALTELPEDISTWTRNQFKTKITELQQLSLKNPALLLNIPVTDYAEYFHFDKTKASFPPHLYDLMVLKQIETFSLFGEKEKAVNLLTDLIKITKESSKSSILPFYELQHLNFSSKNQQDNHYLSKLDSLEQLYHNNPAVVEILNAKARWYMQKPANAGNKRIAYRICEEGILKYPDYERIGLLKSAINEISAKKINFKHAAVIGSDQKLVLEAVTSNITEMVLEIYRFDSTPEKYQEELLSGRNNPKNPGRLIGTKVFSIPFNPDFDEDKSNFEVSLPGYGIYHLRAYPRATTDQVSMAESKVLVSDLTYMKRMLDEEKTGIYILDRTTGKRIRGAKIDIYEIKWSGSGYESKKKAEIVTNRNGYAEYASTGGYFSNFLVISKNNDKYFTDNGFAGVLPPPPPPVPEMEISMFSDRSLYRPGQTVYVKLIAHKSDGKNNSVIAGVKVPVALYDANGTEISTKELITNEFGSAATDFFIPTGSLNGTWSIVANGFSHLAFQVEEYKLPGFEVILKKPAEEVVFNKQVMISGEVKAYAGYLMPESSVRYKIFRITHPFWRFFPRRQEQLVGSGETKTDAQGAFKVVFTPEKDTEINIPAWGRHSYIYRIEADATDLKGETQQGTREISVSEQSLFINATIKDNISLKELTVIPVEVVNIEGEKLTKTLMYELIRLNNTEEYSEDIVSGEYTFRDSVTVLKGFFQSSDASLKIDFSKHKPGRYRFVMRSNDAEGKEIMFEKIIVLYNPRSKKPPVKSYVWHSNQHIECEPGKPAKISFGTSLHKAHILMEVMQGHKTISSRWIIMTNSVKTFNIPFHEQYEDGLEVNFSFVRNGRLFVRNFKITARQKVKTITPKLSVFRDKLKPGEHCEWSVIIPDAQKPAELLLSMYDASLDFLNPHFWHFNPINYQYSAASPRWTTTFRLKSLANGFFNMNQVSIPEINRVQLNHWNISLYSGNHFNIRRRTYAVKEQMDSPGLLAEKIHSGTIENKMLNEASANYDIRNDNVNNLQEVIDELPLPKETKPLSLRTNFNETAFFYPQVYADSTGNFRFSFSMPESLTRWNLKMLAHTKDLYFGQAMETVTTSKELMIRLNKPRFVRESDITELTASIINLSERELKITSRVKITDTKDENEIPIQSAKEQIVVLQPGETKALSWVVGTLYDKNLVVCTVEAETDQFSDGEQHYLAVLPDRILVTESKPFTVKGNADLNIHFDDWKAKSEEAVNSSLSVELSANPVWYVLQALPVLAETSGESTTDIFISWYSHRKAMQIMEENPDLIKIFEQIAASGSQTDILQSPLSKNDALKTLILQETPWVAAAKNEKEQMQRIMTLFNENNQQFVVEKLYTKLLERQMSNGGISWYPGMPENRWVSQMIAEGLTQINEGTSDKDQLKSLTENLLKYLDNAMNQDYIDIRKQKNFDPGKMTINTLQLQYLVIRTHFEAYEMKQEHVEAYDYFVRQTEDHRHRFRLYEKALAARVLHRMKKKDAAGELIQSLRETAIKSNDDGMFWANNKAGYFWNERPVSVHSEIMQAMHEVGGVSDDLQEMKIWLMRQKQTQQWNSPIASLHAIAAITATGEGLVMNNPQYQIYINDQEISNKQDQPGAGYALHKMNESAIPEKLTIKPPVATQATSLAWGAVYRQYFSKLTDVTSSGSGLKLSKTYFLSQTVKNQTVLIPLDHPDAGQLKAGDRIVTRLIISTDRNLEFVALKDLRAACLEPLNQISGTQWKEQLLYYRTAGDASTQYFFHFLPKGSYVFEDVYFINSTGDYSGGMASIQCQYAPEFIAHAPGQRLLIKR